MEKSSIVRYLVAALIASSLVSNPSAASGATLALANLQLEPGRLSVTSSFKVSADAVCTDRETPLNLLPQFVLKLHNPLSNYQKETNGSATGHNAAGTYSLEAEIGLSDSDLQYLKYATSVSLQVRSFSCDFDDTVLYSKTIRLEPPRLDVAFKEMAVRTGEILTSQLQVTAYNISGEPYEIESNEVFDVLPTCIGYYEGDPIPFSEITNQPAGENVYVECSGGELADSHQWREGAINHALGSNRGSVLILSEDEYAVAPDHLVEISGFESSVRQALLFGQSAILYVSQRESDQLTSYGVIDPERDASSAFECQTGGTRPAASSRDLARAIIADIAESGAELVRFWLEGDGFAYCDRLSLDLDNPEVKALELVSDSAVVATGGELHVFELPIWQYVPEAPPLEVTYSYSAALPGSFTIESLKHHEGHFWATGVIGAELILLKFELAESGITLLDQVSLESNDWSSNRLEVAKGLVLIEMMSNVDNSMMTVVVPIDSGQVHELSNLEGEDICGYVPTCSPIVVRINSADVLTLAGVPDAYLANPILVQSQIDYTSSAYVTGSNVLVEITNSQGIAPWSTPISFGENIIWLAGPRGTYIRVELDEVTDAGNSDTVSSEIDSSNSPTMQSQEPKSEKPQGSSESTKRVKIPSISVAKNYSAGDWIDITLDGVEIFESKIQDKILESSVSPSTYSARIPNLSPGLYDLELRGSFGKLTIGGAIRVPEIESSSAITIQLPSSPPEILLTYSLSFTPKWITKQVGSRTKGLNFSSVSCAYRGSRLKARQICSAVASNATQAVRLVKIPGNSTTQIIRIKFKTVP